MTVAAIWPGKNREVSSRALFGKPVWERTLGAVESLKPRRIVWLGRSLPDGANGDMVAGSLDDVASSRDRVVLLSAELPCLTSHTLRRLVGKNKNGARALFPAGGGSPAALAVEARSLKQANPRSLATLATDLGAQAVFCDDAELHAVDSAAAWSHAHHILRLRKLDALLKRGVYIPDPSSVWVDPDVAVGAGATLSPWVRIEGASRVGAHCTIGSFCHLVNATVGAHTVILDHCFIRESRVGKHASIGPFAHLRPASDVGHRARVGNFVELKKSTLGAGAKVSHLAYVGDATLGKDANLGAGTITCNYDGRSKNRTVVGDGAFIGSDVQLVAPVRVGKGAFVAAGSCIVEDVPAHALALARSRQVIKKGWAKNRDQD